MQVLCGLRARTCGRHSPRTIYMSRAGKRRHTIGPVKAMICMSMCGFCVSSRFVVQFKLTLVPSLPPSMSRAWMRQLGGRGMWKGRNP
jgi:hypothetical protein